MVQEQCQDMEVSQQAILMISTQLENREQFISRKWLEGGEPATGFMNLRLENGWVCLSVVLSYPTIRFSNSSLSRTTNCNNCKNQPLSLQRITLLTCRKPRQMPRLFSKSVMHLENSSKMKMTKTVRFKRKFKNLLNLRRHQESLSY